MDAPPVQYVKTSDGVSLAYAVTGKGRTLVHLPILWSHFSLQWRTGIRRLYFEGLAERFQLVLYDGRGQGLSTRGLGGELPLESLDADLEAVVRLLKASRFLLHTTSLHGLVAIRYAVRHPERVAGLVLWNYIDTSVAAFAESFRSMAEADWETHLASNVLSFHAATGFPASESPLVKQVLREAIGKEELLAITGALRSTTAESLLGELRVPVLVLASRESARHERAARWLAARIPNAQLQLFDGPAGGMVGEEGAVPPAVQVMEQFAAGLDYGLADSSENTSIGNVDLSSREIEVLRLVGHGLSNLQIADELVISVNTVRRHVSNIFDKTGVATRAQAVAYARDHGIE
jgi:DNA-binding NarL/FixJ family response regulator